MIQLEKITEASTGLLGLIAEFSERSGPVLCGRIYRYTRKLIEAETQVQVLYTLRRSSLQKIVQSTLRRHTFSNIPFSEFKTIQRTVTTTLRPLECTWNPPTVQPC